MKKLKLLKKKSILRKKKTKKVSKKNRKTKSRIHIGGKGKSLMITYNGKAILNGSNITGSIDYSKAPLLTINNSDINKTYLITMTDPDAPNGEDRTSENFTFTHWVFTMINGQINNTFVSYYPPSPPKGTHRYQFNLYDISSINTDELKVNNNNNADYYKTTLQPFLDKKNIIINPLLPSFQFRVQAD